eukprot:EG_transcript_2315
MSFNARHVHEVFKGARLTPWTKYSDAEIEQLAALRRLYQKHFNCVLEVVEPMKKDKGKAAKNVMAGAAAGAVVGGVAGGVTSMATPGVNLIPGVPGAEMMVGAGAGAAIGGGAMALREKARAVPDHPQEQLWRGDVELLLLVDKKGYPVLKESTAREKLDNIGELVSSNSLAFNVNSVLLHVLRYIHHDRVSGAFKKIAFQENDPRCIFCLIVVEWLHKELIPCPEIDRETRLLGQLDSWIKFMKDISAHNVFSTAEAKADKGYATMDALLLNIDQQFMQMRFHIEAEVRERSIGEQLRGISNTGKTLVSRLFQFLTYVLCGEDRVPPFFSINAFYQAIKRPDLSKFVSSSPHGRLLAEIAQMLEVQEYLDVWPEDNIADPYALRAPMDPKQAAYVQGLLFLVRQQRLPQDADVDAVVRLRAVAPMFFNERQLLLQFLRLHAQLPALTRLLLACKEAAFLAGAFGELMFLRNDNSRKILEFLVDGTLSVCNAVKEELDELWTKASNCRRRQRVDQSGDSDWQHWEDNWQQAYRIFNGMGTNNDVGQQLDQILRELNRVQGKLRNPSANLPQIRARMNQFVQLLDSVRTSCPWLPVDDELKGLIKEQARHIKASAQPLAIGSPSTPTRPPAPPSSLTQDHSPPGKDLLACWDDASARLLVPAAGPSDTEGGGTYTLEMALKESLQCEVQARVKLEKDCAALRRLLEERTAEWDREKRRLNDHLAKLTGQRAADYSPATSGASSPTPMHAQDHRPPMSPTPGPRRPSALEPKDPWVSEDGVSRTQRGRSPLARMGHRMKDAMRSLSLDASSRRKSHGGESRSSFAPAPR